MADDDDLAIEIETGGDETLNDPVENIERQYKALQADIEKERSAKEAANRRAADERAAAEAARQEAQAARTSLADRELDTITASIATAQAEGDAAQRDYAAASEIGDWAKQAEAQRRMSNAAAKTFGLERDKAELELRKSSPRAEEPARRANDPFEEHVSRFSDRTAQWMREHRDWIIDPKRNAKVVGAHNFAVSEGKIPDTDEYFDYVERMLGLRGDAARNGAANGTSPRRATPVVAPVNGGAGAHSSGAENRGPTVTLSRNEEKMAKGVITWNKGERDAKGVVVKDGDPRLGQPIGIQEYARRKLAMQKGGFYREG